VIVYRNVCDRSRRLRATVGGLVLAALGSTGWSAPLDALLTANPERDSPSGYLEMAGSLFNKNLDLLKVRDDDPLLAGTSAGDFKGWHLSAGVPVGKDIWLTGAYAHKAISSGVDTYRYSSWQAAMQYRLSGQVQWRPAIALRVSAWGDSAKSTETTTPVDVPGAILNSVKVTQPADRSLQADLIATWNLSPAAEVSSVFSAGQTRLSYGTLNATTTRNGCNYALSFSGNDIFGTLAEPCNVPGGVIQQFFDRSGDYGVDVAKEIAWRSVFFQYGVNGSWRSGPWTVKGGWLVHTARREDVDAILAQRGRPVFQVNKTVILEADRALNKSLHAFARMQLTSNLFLSDIPVTYNTSTSGHFGSRYSLYTLGVRWIL
jgi:hypothetical protein